MLSTYYQSIETQHSPFCTILIRDAHTRTDVLARVLRTPRAGYKGYGVQRVPWPRSTDFSTEDDDLFRYGVPGVRSTRSTDCWEYGFWYGWRLYFLARSTKSTEYEKYWFLKVRISHEVRSIFKHGARKVHFYWSTNEHFFAYTGFIKKKYANIWLNYII